MSRKHFSWLLAVTIVAAVLVLALPTRTGRESGLESETLLPGFAARVNEVSEVGIFGAGEKSIARLKRSEERWVVEDAQSYVADWPRLKSLLAGLAQARIVEAKTNNPEYYVRLGVEDPGSPDSASVLVRLTHGDQQTGVLVGKQAQDRDGQYVRLEGSAQALLIDRELDVSATAADWLEREIVDVAESEVVEVRITHPDGETVHARRVSAEEQDFALQSIPAGREVQSAWSVNALGGSLSGLRLDAVRPDSDLDWSKASRLNVLTAGGLALQVELVSVDEEGWLRLVASAPGAGAASADADAPPPEDGAADAAEAAGADSGPGLEAAEEPGAEQRAAEINARVAGWAYAVPEYSFSVMTRRLKDILKPETEE